MKIENIWFSPIRLVFQAGYIFVLLQRCEAFDEATMFVFLHHSNWDMSQEIPFDTISCKKIKVYFFQPSFFSIHGSQPLHQLNAIYARRFQKASTI